MKVLIAEDEAMNRRLLEVSVQKWGHEPVLAHEGDEAWALLDSPDAPQIALLDWMMPGMDGLEICRRLRESDDPRMIYLIMVTTNAQPGDIVRGLEAGADDYVTKPFDPHELHARLDVGVRMVELHQRLADRERRLAAARTRLAEKARFEAAVEAMSDGIVTADDQWRITYANRAAELLLNLVAGGYLGESLERVLGQFELSENIDALRGSTEEATALEISRTDAGVTLWIDGRVTRMFDEHQNLTDVILTLRDATDRIEAEKRETRFMNSISHKLRTPLTVIGGTLEVMAELPPERLDEAWDRLLPICRRQVRRLDETIQRLLKFRELSASQPSLEAAPVDIAAVLDEVEAVLRARYPETQVQFQTSTNTDVTTIPLTREDLGLIVEELGDNAIKFAEAEPVQVEIAMDCDEQRALSISVTDHGPGIPHEYHDRVFEGYLQIEEIATGQVAGLGLGLRIVKQIAEAHGGTVTIHSELGQGTTVTVAVPLGERSLRETAGRADQF